jgi:heme/copper-type cytochrome/quinol oxidase subunit 4
MYTIYLLGATVVGAARRLEAIRAAEPFAVIVEEACEVRYIYLCIFMFIIIDICLYFCICVFIHASEYEDMSLYLYTYSYVITICILHHHTFENMYLCSF